MNPAQLKRINDEIERLEKRLIELEEGINSLLLKGSMKDYIGGRIDSLKWVKENL